ncbi:Smr/MutS family protein [Neisseria sp. Ec49-e6-T10]|uniref:Smr/MutS family protein n=1 Tax=Neisseria sp. Ec49-e6-T10 TaxID=3140744 RepID=UPI003EBE36FD
MKNDFKEQLKQAKKKLVSKPIHSDTQTSKPDDQFNFAQMLGTKDIIPLKPNNQYIAPQQKIYIKKRQQEIDTDQECYFYIGQIFEDAPKQYHKNGRGITDIQKLLNYDYPIIATLDLHGQTQHMVQETLNQFCDYVQHKGVCARIIHGSGLGSHNARPVLKNIVRTWLCRHPEILAYTEEHKNNDGSVLILLKKLHHK